MRKMKKVIFFSVLLIAITSCKSEEQVTPVKRSPKLEDKTKTELILIDIQESHEVNLNKDTLSYLALGDSYTIGTGVEKRFRWPNQLVDSLKVKNINLHEVKIVAGAGWTAGNLFKVLEGRNLDTKYDFVSLLIGVNNQFKGSLFAAFQKEFIDLLSFSLERAKSRSSVFVLSIPDYGVTPFGGNQASISEEIDMYNSWIQETCEANNIRFYNITGISRKAETDLSLLASDNLHPSGKMYAQWVKQIIKNPPELLTQ